MRNPKDVVISFVVDTPNPNSIYWGDEKPSDSTEDIPDTIEGGVNHGNCEVGCPFTWVSGPNGTLTKLELR